MHEKLREIEERYQELSHFLADPGILSDPSRYARIAKEHADLEVYISPFEDLKRIEKDVEEHQTLLSDTDKEMRDLAAEELVELEVQAGNLKERLKELFVPRDPNDERNVVLEIRAGTGGEEAGLFAADLFRMYCRYAEVGHWGVEIISMNETGIGGVKEVIAMVSGKGAFARFKYESGVHRVQRVPETEASGRIHTSAVTVAVLPEAQDVEVSIDQKDLRIDTYRSSGAGGQHVNKTDSAIRITHIPTGLVVTCQDEKSQHKNKAKALNVLKSRLFQQMQDETDAKMVSKRRSQVGTGDRSERIRTYNFPQGRVTDHRIGLTLHKLPQILDGDLDDLIDGLHAHFKALALSSTEE
ncbi:MAG: peptide chain release factor 1 [Thermodesulfobacteriota bacterium]|nr:peptide chain release factor 1 [Thermodesulfobacteriota bacterium]